MKDKIVNEIPMNLAEVKEELEKIKKRDKELSFRAQKSMDYLNQVVSLKYDDAKALYKKIDALTIPRLKEIHIQKIISILPSTEAELKVVLQGYTITVTKESLKKIIDVVKPYISTKK